jgi:membrane-associated phospholipid phosphatase
MKKSHFSSFVINSSLFYCLLSTPTAAQIPFSVGAATIKMFTPTREGFLQHTAQGWSVVRTFSPHKGHQPASLSPRILPTQGFPFFAQEDSTPYKINVAKGVPIVASGSALVLASILVRSHREALTLEQVNALNRNDVWSVDRSAIDHHSQSAANLSNVFLYSSVAAPLLFLAPAKTRHDFGRIAIMQFESVLFAYGITSLTKSMTQRVRPFNYNPTVSLDDKLTKNANESFFSGHVSTSAAMSFFMASTFSQYYPDSQLKPLVWTYAIVWPAATGYMRYRAGAHFLSDIAVGYVVGAATGYLVPKIHQKLRRKKY